MLSDNVVNHKRCPLPASKVCTKHTSIFFPHFEIFFGFFRSSLLSSLFSRKDKDSTLSKASKMIPEEPLLFDASLLGQDYVISTGDEGHAKSTMTAVCA